MTRSPSLKLYSKIPRRYAEARLQRAVCQWLMLAGVPGMSFLHPANEGQRTPRTGAFLKSIGMRPGAADLFIFHNSRAFALELKAKGQKQSPAQVAFAAEMALAGIPYETADNIDDAIRILKEWHVIRAAFQDIGGGSVTPRSLGALMMGIAP